MFCVASYSAWYQVQIVQVALKAPQFEEGVETTCTNRLNHIDLVIRSGLHNKKYLLPSDGRRIRCVVINKYISTQHSIQYQEIVYLFRGCNLNLATFVSVRLFIY